MKTFRGDLIKLYLYLKNEEPFAFARFSDGEEFILQNKYLEINDNSVIAGEQIFNKGFSSEDHKQFNPVKHQWFREKLWDAFVWDQERYFKGIPCKCCVGEERNKWFLDVLPIQRNLTWANLLVNGNYSFFIDTFIPLFQKRSIVLVCSELANLFNLPFIPEKDFRVGQNCMINNYNIIETIKQYIDMTSTGKVFLFSASSLSKVAIHQLYKYNNKNTYIDIGTTFNYYMGMSLDRDYLKNKWCGTKYKMGDQICVW
jgi:hypothetical protein